MLQSGAHDGVSISGGGSEAGRGKRWCMGQGRRSRGPHWPGEERTQAWVVGPSRGERGKGEGMEWRLVRLVREDGVCGRTTAPEG